MFSSQLSFLWRLYVGVCAFMYFKNAITYVYLHILLFLLNDVSWTSLHVSICTHVIFVKDYIVFVHQCEYKPIYLPSFLLHLGHVIPFFFSKERAPVCGGSLLSTQMSCALSFLPGFPGIGYPGLPQRLDLVTCVNAWKTFSVTLADQYTLGTCWKSYS